MLKIEYYEDEVRKLDGRNYCCAYIDASDYHGYPSIVQFEPRCATYEEAKKELLKYAIELRDAIDELVERENK